MLGVALSAGGCSNPTIGTWVAEHYEGMVAATPLSFSYPPGTLVRVNGDVRLSVLADDCLPQTEEFEPLVGAETSVAGTQAISVGAEATIPSVEDAVEALAEAGGEIIGSIGGEFDYESEIQVTLVGGRIVSFDDRQVRMLASVLSQECWDWLRQGAELVIRSLDVNEIAYEQGSEVIFAIGVVGATGGASLMYQSQARFYSEVRQPVTVAVSTLNHDELRALLTPSQ